MKTCDITPIIENIHKPVESHRLEVGSYARWLWQNEKGDREMGSNPYGVADAAVECGFSELSYFTRVFKKTLGILPSEVRDEVFSLNNQKS